MKTLEKPKRIRGTSQSRGPPAEQFGPGLFLLAGFCEHRNHKPKGEKKMKIEIKKSNGKNNPPHLAMIIRPPPTGYPRLPFI